MPQFPNQCAPDSVPVSDVESLRWLRALSDTGPEREDAAERLHALLLRAARFEVARRQQASGAGRGAGSIDDLAVQAADDLIAAVLTPHQLEVHVAHTLEDVPIDVLAELRATTRGALYKTLHDARRKLRARLAQDGLTIEGQAA